MAAKEQVREQIKISIKEPRQYQVLIYNDDFTPMDFEVEVLMGLFDNEHTQGKLCGCGNIPKGYRKDKGRRGRTVGKVRGLPP